MNSPAHLWYYVDARGQQQGPVSTALILGHARQGLLTDSSLLWRDGLAEWQPLSSLRAELGLVAAVSPGLAAAQSAPAAAPRPRPPAASSAPNSPYAPPSATLDRQAAWSATAESDIVYAGFLRRWAALFIDTFIIGVCAQLIGLFLGVFMAIGLGSMSDPDTAGAAMVGFMGFYYIGYFVMAGLYFSLLESSANQATLGKMALGIKVTDGEGHRLSYGQALGRWFAAALSHITLWIGFLMAGFTERKRALHDLVANTLVVDRWAFTEYPERQKRELGGCLIVFLVVMGLMIVLGVVGMLAAIALPAYQDYTERARRGAELPQSLPTETTAQMAPAPTLPGQGRLWLAPARLT